MTCRLWERRLFLPVLVLAMAVWVYGQYGFQGALTRDHAIYLYGGQKMAEGIPPYVSIFDAKGPLASALAALGVVISKVLRTDDIYTVRALFFLVGCLVVVSISLLAQHLFRTWRPALLAALTFLGFAGFAQYAGTGPEPKVPMLLFVVLSLLLTSQRKWFWAGVCGALSFLTWQPTLVFAVVTLFLAATEVQVSRARAVLLSLAGIGLPLLITAAYFLYHGALFELVDAMILFNLFYLDHGPPSLARHLQVPINQLLAGYDTALVLVLLGFLMMIAFYVWRRTRCASLRDMLTRDPFAPLLLSFPAPVVWSLIDFQGVPDWYIFLPFVAIGAGYFIELAIRYVERYGGTRPILRSSLIAGMCIILVAVAMLPIPSRRESGLTEQRQAAAEVERLLGKKGKFVSIGAPQLLVLLHRTNPNPYVFIIRGIDRYMDARVPGGFQGWLQQLEAYDPKVIAFGVTAGEHREELVNWLKTRYRTKKVEPWTLWIKKLAQQ